jgi:hypothetical protein
MWVDTIRFLISMVHLDSSTRLLHTARKLYRMADKFFDFTCRVTNLHIEGDLVDQRL